MVDDTNSAESPMDEVQKRIPELWCPFAERVSPELTTRGEYPQKYPNGAIVHYTAGSYASTEIELARGRGFSYFFIDKDGKIFQPGPLDRWGSHAGMSHWDGLGDNVSSKLVGIEVDCAGILTPDGRGNFSTWWGANVPHDEVRVITAPQKNRKAGVYHIFRDEQEEALARLLVWLKGNNPDVFSFDYVLGHDEVAPDRKLDPGGSLSMTMPDFRSYLEQRYRDEQELDKNRLDAPAV